MTNKITKVAKNSGQFEKGHGKIGGRKKGTPNKKTLIFINELSGFKTIDELITLYESTHDEHIKFAILKEFLKYQYPQRKAIEMETKKDNDLKITCEFVKANNKEFYGK